MNADEIRHGVQSRPHRSQLRHPSAMTIDAFGERIGFLAPVRFDIADDHVASGRQFAPRGFKHGEGLAHPRRHAEKNFQPAAMLLRFVTLDCGEKRIGIRAVVVHHSLG